jgi:hypothetical protein
MAQDQTETQQETEEAEAQYAPASPETKFRLPSRPIKPNPYFMDILKKDLSKKYASKQKDLFTLYDGHLKKISAVFADCPEEHQFWLHGGKSIKNLKELYDELGIMPDKVYAHHAGNEKNDFASWVAYVFKDDKLSNALRNATSKEEAMVAIASRAEEVLFSMGDPKKKDSVFSDIIKQLREKNTTLENEIRKKKEWLITRHKELEDREKTAIQKEKDLQDKYMALEKQENELREKILGEAKKIEGMQNKFTKDQVEFQAMKHDLVMVYKDLDKMIDAAKVHIQKGEFTQAKVLISMIRHFYSQIDKSDPRKKEFWTKINELKNHVDEVVGKIERGMV